MYISIVHFVMIVYIEQPKKEKEIKEQLAYENWTI